MKNEFNHEIQGELQPAFFYIPDISGFTNFINNSNLTESTKLIHDLLEVIIDSNILNLKIAEIQGDSIWFYRLGNPVSIQELERQTIKTYTDFQAYLMGLEEKHELLEGAKNLTLKILVHHGKVGTAVVKGTLKLIGSDTVIASRIMKNNINSHEYLLMTEQYLKTQDRNLEYHKKAFCWDTLKSGHCEYEYLGTINYKYISLTPLRSSLHNQHK